MASTNGSGRPSGCVSIPVEIIRESNPGGRSGSHSRHDSPFRTQGNDSIYSGVSDSPPWSSNTTGRFQPRRSPGPTYDRVITNSQFNQPFNDRSSYQTYQEPQYRHPQQQMYEPGQSNFSRSNEDLFSSPFDSIRHSTQTPYSSLIPPSFGSGFRLNSDFVQPDKYSSPLRRSFDALNDFADMHQSFPTTRPYPSEQQHQQQQPQPQPQQQQQQQQQQQPYYRSTYQTQHRPQSQQQQQPAYVNQAYINPNIVYTNEFGAPTDRYQPNTFQGTGVGIPNDRSRSPASQRGASPGGPSPTTSKKQQHQQGEEPELKMAKDADGPIPMPAPTSSSPPTQSNDQQVPSTDTSANAPSPPLSSPPPPPPPPPPPQVAEPIRDSNSIALGKLEQMKQSLDVLEKEVDSFIGSTRNERAYVVLDEKALKIMIRCDELVDVSADIKEKRKEMIRNVQRVIDKLESKVPTTPAVEQNSNPMDTATAITTEGSTTNNNQETMARKSLSPVKGNVFASTAETEQSISP